MQRRLALALMLLATEAIYLPWFVLRGANTLYGWDYMFLHARRLAFARDALLGPRHQLPGWYPREMLGTPFAANLQDSRGFPRILRCCCSIPTKPTRRDRDRRGAGCAVRLSILPARGTLAHSRCRRRMDVRLFRVLRVEGDGRASSESGSVPGAAVVAMAGGSRSRESGRRRDMLALALGTACVVLAGHPQLPAYAVATAMLYVLWRGRGWLRAKLCGAMALGIGATMIAWWPMLLLIRRSSRMLPLDRAANDVTLPYHRLLGLIAPGIDGWPAGVAPSAQHLFTRILAGISGTRSPISAFCRSPPL